MLGAIHAKVNKRISTEKEPIVYVRCRHASRSFRGTWKVLNALSPDAKKWYTVDDEGLGDRTFQQRPETCTPLPRKDLHVCLPAVAGGGWAIGSLLPQGNMLEVCGLGKRNLPHRWSWTLLSVLMRMFPFSRKPAQYSDQYDLWLLSYPLIREETKPVTLRIQQKGASEVFAWGHWGLMVGKPERRNRTEPNLRDVEPGANLLSPRWPTRVPTHIRMNPQSSPE